MEKPLVIYHGGCDDGVASAWAVRHYYGKDNVELYPGVYQKAPPDCTGRDVIMVDFSYKRPVLEGMIAQCRSMLILDHHDTAEKELAFLPDLRSILANTPASWNFTKQEVKAAALFDQKKSGAGLTWDFFFGEETRPLFINYIEDRDLFRHVTDPAHALVGTNEFSIALRSFPQDVETWDNFVMDLENTRQLVRDGEPIWRYYMSICKLIAKEAYQATLGGVLVMACNSPYFAASEVAGMLAENGAPLGICFFERADGMFQYSVRSRKGGIHAGEAVKIFGGGGHPGAAGFSSTYLVHRRIP